MKQILFFVILFSIFSSCSLKTNESSQIENEVKSDSLDKDIQSNPEFEAYLKSIEYLSLPFNTPCGVNYTDYPIVDKKLKEKYAGKLIDPYRRIPTQLPVEIVMELAPADYLLPIIKTYSKEGDLIDSFQVFSGYCGGEPGWQGVEYFSLMEKLKMIHIDSVWEYEIDSLYNEIEGTLKGTVTTSNFQILRDGKIVKLDSTVSYFN